MSFRVLWLLSTLLLFTEKACAEGVDFEKQIQPLLQKHCLGCHGPEKQRGGLRLDSKKAALQGGDSGALWSSKSDDSLLIKRITAADPGERMPPKGEPLSVEQVTLVKKWIDEGAHWPEQASGQEMAGHWAFQPVKRPTVPAGNRSPIDAFIAERLGREKLTLSTEADRRTLIRRLSFDLVGLPPTPEEIERFVNDPDPRAYEKLVERLLASPHFGERWARHWLDIVRFAESDGFETNQPRANAWPYRDYVVRAFNEDRPFDRFVREQLAGDLLGEDAATGFLVGGPVDRVLSPDPVLTAQQRADELHDILSTTSSTFLGLTVGCARCHAHKFDPIPQADYYSLKAIFAGVRHGERPWMTPGNKLLPADALAARPGSKPEGYRPAVQAGKNIDRFSPVMAKFVRFTVNRCSTVEPCIDELEAFTTEAITRNVAAAKEGAKATASGTFPGHSIHRLEHINDGLYGNSKSWISNEPGKGWVTIEFARPEMVDRVVWSRDRENPPRFRDRLATGYVIEVSNDGQSWQAVASSADRAQMGANVVYAGVMTKADDVFRLHRGEVMQNREKIAPGMLTSIGPKASIASDLPEAKKRLALANWIVDPANPLTARVIVNRLWQHHFGIGLVTTPGDFGRNGGGAPSHPDLLDWLAVELVEKGWSLKHLHRQIVLSATYRQSSAAHPEGLRQDAQTRLLWRYPPRRLEAEILRDAILSVSGKLDLSMGGPGFDLFEPNTNYVKVYQPKTNFGPDTFRRMVYQAKPRMQLDDTFGAFDCPDAGQVAPKRSSSTTPLQALNLLNSPFLLQQSTFLAERLQGEAGSDVAAQVKLAFRLSFGREATEPEVKAATSLARQHGLTAVCRALLNANEFLSIR